MKVTITGITSRQDIARHYVPLKISETNLKFLNGKSNYLEFQVNRFPRTAFLGKGYKSMENVQGRLRLIITMQGIKFHFLVDYDVSRNAGKDPLYNRPCRMLTHYQDRYYAEGTTDEILKIGLPHIKTLCKGVEEEFYKHVGPTLEAVAAQLDPAQKWQAARMISQAFGLDRQQRRRGAYRAPPLVYFRRGRGNLTAVPHSSAQSKRAFTPLRISSLDSFSASTSVWRPSIRWSKPSMRRSKLSIRWPKLSIRRSRLSNRPLMGSSFWSIILPIASRKACSSMLITPCFDYTG